MSKGLSWLIKKLSKLLNIKFPSDSLNINELFQILSKNEIHIHIHNAPSVSEKVYKENQSAVINKAQLTPEQKEQVDEIIRKHYESGAPILERKPMNYLEDYRMSTEKSDAIDIINYLRDKISKEDLVIWEEAIYVKILFDRMVKSNSKEERRKIRNQIKYVKTGISKKYGAKGINIANLCSSGYIEKWLKPIFDVVSKSENTQADKIKKFQKLYSHVVESMGMTILVSAEMKEENIVAEFEHKIKYIDIINIHGVGMRNINTIKNVCDRIKREFVEFKEWKSHCEHDVMTVIFVRQEILQ